MNVRSIRIHAGNGYNVTISSNILDGCGDMLARCVGPCHGALITDDQVWPLYGERVKASLEQAGFVMDTFVFPAGEASKNMGTLTKMLEFLAEKRLTRTDCVVALGGGVVGDAAGFAAGCYLRGIRYVQLPTTLLAAVDSSVGGKTAVDLGAGKNLAGLFHQPSAVICDCDVFSTLSGENFACGAAEAVKTGVLAGAPLFQRMQDGIRSGDLPDVVAGCVSYKGKVVEGDEREAGQRKLLNLGHTPGHGVELISGYAVPHGYAVSMGLALMARAAVRLGIGSAECARRIEQALVACELPITCPYSAEQLAEAALGDKKRAGNAVTLVFPREIGDCVLLEYPVSELRKVFSLGMEAL